MAVHPFDPATQQMPFKALLDRIFKTVLEPALK
jgi:hypothetical protein